MYYSWWNLFFRSLFPASFQHQPVWRVFRVAYNPIYQRARMRMHQPCTLGISREFMSTLPYRSYRVTTKYLHCAAFVSLRFFHSAASLVRASCTGNVHTSIRRALFKSRALSSTRFALVQRVFQHRSACAPNHFVTAMGFFENFSAEHRHVYAQQKIFSEGAIARPENFRIYICTRWEFFILIMPRQCLSSKNYELAYLFRACDYPKVELFSRLDI